MTVLARDPNVAVSKGNDMTETDRQYMGTAADAKVALIEKARIWRELRQPRIDTRSGHLKIEAQEQEARFQLANAAMLWLWHEENPVLAQVDGILYPTKETS